MATKGCLGIFIDSKAVYAAFALGPLRTSCTVPIAGVPEDLDFAAKMTDAVGAAAQQLAPTQKTALLAVPGDSAMVRCFALPALPKKEEVSAVRFEAQKYVPFDLKDLCYDYESTLDASKKKIRVIFYAGKRSVIERLSSAVEAAGLTVTAVEILSNSLARSFNHEITKDSGAVYALIRAVEELSMEVIIAKNQAVLISRHVAVERMPGTPQWDPSSLLAELRLSFDYFDEIFKGEAISKIFVTASSREAMQALTETIQRAFSIPTEAVSSTSGTVESAAGLAIAHGLTLRDTLPSRGKKINLKISNSEHQGAGPQATETIKDFATKVLAASAAILVGVYFFFNQTVQSRQKELRGFTVSVPVVAGITPQTGRTEMEDMGMQLDLRLMYFAELVDRRRFLTSRLNSIAKNTPTDIHLISFIFEDDVNLKGKPTSIFKMDGFVDQADQVTGLSIINKFVTALNTEKDFSQGFSQIKIVSAKQAALPNNKPGIRFELECANAPRLGGA